MMQDSRNGNSNTLKTTTKSDALAAAADAVNPPTSPSRAPSPSSSTPRNAWVDETVQFPFQLDAFQMRAMQHIRENEHVLVAAHTSAGKTTVAEYAINWCLLRGQRVLYTAPIKALSNQKYSEFRGKARRGFLHCTPEEIGIVTGDVQNNPDGRVLIATTEIVHNHLYRDVSYFDDVGAVVFDEVHYINDPERGRVWEGAIVMMPHHVLMVMLSATIPRPDTFTSWIASIKSRPVGLVTTEYRPVPLDHFVFWDDRLQPLVVENQSHPTVYDEIRRARLAIGGHRGAPPAKSGAAGSTKRATPGAVDRFNCTSFLNRAIQHLLERERLPGFFFCFSRRLCGVYADAIQRSLVDPEASARAVKRFQRLLHLHVDVGNHTLPQVEQLGRWLAKGVAIHHSGLLPSLKEIVETLFAEGHICVLFVTETFAVGINLATRCVVLTDVNKYDGHRSRLLRADEYQQIAGRAGRRGLDTRGTCVLLPGLQRATPQSLPTAESLLRVVIGKKAELSSRFQLDGTFVLATIASEHQALDTVLRSSMMTSEIQTQVHQMDAEIRAAREQLDTTRMACVDYQACTATPARCELFERYGELVASEQHARQAKQRRRLQTQRHALVQDVDLALECWQRAQATREQLQTQEGGIAQLAAQRDGIQHSAARVTRDTLVFLATHGYVQPSALETLPTDDAHFLTAAAQLQLSHLTVKGRSCSMLRECPGALVSELVHGRDARGVLDGLSGDQMAAVLACMIEETFVTDAPFDAVAQNGVLNDTLLAVLRVLRDEHARQHKLHDDAYMYYTGCVNPILAEYAWLWCQGHSVAETLSRVSEHIDLGNFVRAMLKLHGMLDELRDVYAMLGHPNEQKLCDLQERGAIVRDAVRVDSMYFRS